MLYFLIQVIIATAAILQVSPLPVKVSVSPNYIITDVGTESANITCTVQLDPVSAASAHWITWSHIRIPGLKPVTYNDTVIDQAKYSVHGMSSITSNTITQILTIHGIEEDDIGTYICFFNIVGDSRRLSASFSLVLKNDIAPVRCYYPTEFRELRCSCPPGDPLITLQIIAKDGNVLAENTQLSCNRGPFVKYKVPTESLYQGEQFICVATSPGSVKTRECIFTPNMPYENSSFSVYYQSTVDASVNTEVVLITTNSNDESGNRYLTSPLTPPVSYNQNTNVETSNQIQSPEESIIVIYIIGIINIVMNVALLYIIMRKNKHKRVTEMSMEPHDTRRKHGDSTEPHTCAPPQGDDYLDLNYTPNVYDQLGVPA